MSDSATQLLRKVTAVVKWKEANGKSSNNKQLKSEFEGQKTEDAPGNYCSKSEPCSVFVQQGGGFAGWRLVLIQLNVLTAAL